MADVCFSTPEVVISQIDVDSGMSTEFGMQWRQQKPEVVTSRRNCHLEIDTSLPLRGWSDLDEIGQAGAE